MVPPPLTQAVGLRGGRALLDRPGRLQERRPKMLAKGDEVSGTPFVDLAKEAAAAFARQ
jgi:hypothetical protein